MLLLLLFHSFPPRGHLFSKFKFSFILMCLVACLSCVDKLFTKKEMVNGNKVSSPYCT